ncbi:murein L,D-transpeptidase catalytic domain family protein [Flavobacterium gilvum]|uniref:Uncharacterized protein n=1 Tax=Flavobacterium gilvum TaxID=1492737 RepID=A0AAC9I4I8_9FLAO|nr:murein L,D-transpeptidase catalytic domain family protein [Flavobacterium gilvum]AOW09246.1 hypothetical protein EM308_06855 [Flavobacterium gilvum]KFC60119.1 hypothetical protein FEM08_11200 [Flavobacterium gilvum]
MFYKFFIAIPFLLASLSFTGKTEVSTTIKSKKLAVSKTISDIDSKIQSTYNSLQTNQFQLPNKECFCEALKGFYAFKANGLIKKDILTLIDFSLSSNSKRLWIIDLTTNEILIQTLVAHGKNTGDEFANNFSNIPESFKSSLGFYATGEEYYGKHGNSLKLDGLEKGINDSARERAIVIHGADYVSESFIKRHNRLGRSQGCPAVPVELATEIISMIKDQSCLFIYHPSLNES